MWGAKRYYNEPSSKSTCQTKQREYPSEVIKALMDSESQESYDEEYSQEQSIAVQQRETPPPLINNKYEPRKENLSHDSNKIQMKIKYTSYRLDGQKILDPNAHHNTLNLEEASIIKDSVDTLSYENQKLKQEVSDQRNRLNFRIKQLQHQNKTLKNQVYLLHEQQQTKDNAYEETYRQLQKKNEQIQRLEKRISQLKLQMHDETKKNTKKQGQLSRYLSGANKQQQTQVNDLSTKREQDVNQKIKQVYNQVSQYIIKRVQQLKNNLMQHRMSKTVEQIIETFMTEMVNINSVTVSRAISKQKFDSIHNKNSHVRTVSDLEMPLYIKSGLFRNSRIGEGDSNRTPVKHEVREKSQELRNLQKSLNKLKQMEKSFQNPSCYTSLKQNFDSLQRSSVLDRSNRSKSRRKKIFQ